MTFLIKWATFSAAFIGFNITSQETLALDETKEKVQAAVTKDAFSRTGVITKNQRTWSETANPSYALFNCTRTSMATVYMLETGVTPPISVIPFTFDPTRHLTKQFPDLIANMQEGRGCFYVGCTKEELDGYMHMLGTGTHALVSAENRLSQNIPFISRTGHVFNYAVVEKEGSLEFEIIETYGGSYTRMAEENPEAFFARYQDDLEVVIFYNATPTHLNMIDASIADAKHLARPASS